MKYLVIDLASIVREGHRSAAQKADCIVGSLPGSSSQVRFIPHAADLTFFLRALDSQNTDRATWKIIFVESLADKPSVPASLAVTQLAAFSVPFVAQNGWMPVIAKAEDLGAAAKTMTLPRGAMMKEHHVYTAQMKAGLLGRLVSRGRGDEVVVVTNATVADTCFRPVDSEDNWVLRLAGTRSAVLGLTGDWNQAVSAAVEALPDHYCHYAFQGLPVESSKAVVAPSSSPQPPVDTQRVSGSGSFFSGAPSSPAVLPVSSTVAGNSVGSQSAVVSAQPGMTTEASPLIHKDDTEEARGCCCFGRRQ